MKISMQIIILAISTLIGGTILAINWLYLKELGMIFQLLNIFGIFIIVVPILLVQYLFYSKKKEMEDMFPIFLRDFVEAIRSGMNLTQAIESVSKNDYKSLTPFVKRLAAQLDWGFPVELALKKFAEGTKSRMIARTISSVIESYRFGGNIADTFEALSSTAVEIDRLRKERTLYLHSQMITGYIVFFVFLGVIIALERYLVPSLTTVSVTPLTGEEGVSMTQLTSAYHDLFFHLVLMQGFFAGLTVGKMAEGAMVAGLKHSAFMVMVGVIAFTLFG